MHCQTSTIVDMATLLESRGEDRLLSHAISMNNGAADAMAARDPVSGSAGAQRDIMAALADALTTFQRLLFNEETSDSAAASEVGISFGSPVASLATIPNSDGDNVPSPRIGGDSSRAPVDLGDAGHYVFNYPVSFRTLSRNEDDTPAQDSSSQWGGPIMSLQVYVGCTIFNMALLYHLEGVVKNKARPLDKAGTLYHTVIDVLQREAEDRYSSFCGGQRSTDAEDPLVSRRRRSLDSSLQHIQEQIAEECPVGLVTLQIACWNNLAHIRYCQGNFRQAMECLSMIQTLSQRTNVAASTDTANTSMSWVQRNNYITQELLNQAMLTQMLLRDDPHLAAAA